MVVAPLLLTPENLSHLQAQHSPMHPHHHGVFLTPADVDAAPPSPGLASPVRSEYSWDDSYDCNGTFLFHDLADLIESHVARARASQPAAFSSRSSFNMHWTRVFADVTQTAHLKATIPDCLFLPCREFMRVKFEGLPAAPNGFDSAYFSSGPSSDGHLHADSLSLPQPHSRSRSSSGSSHGHSPEIFIEAPFGETITKEFFLHRLAEALYGEPAVGVAPLVGGEDDRPVLLRFGWSKSNGGEHLQGPLTVYCEGLSSKQ